MSAIEIRQSLGRVVKTVAASLESTEPADRGVPPGARFPGNDLVSLVHIYEEGQRCIVVNRLLQARQGWGHHTLTALALYWVDGTRSLLDIADLVELETGGRDVELLLAYFRLLEKLGFVEF